MEEDSRRKALQYVDDILTKLQSMRCCLEEKIMRRIWTGDSIKSTLFRVNADVAHYTNVYARLKMTPPEMGDSCSLQCLQADYFDISDRLSYVRRELRQAKRLPVLDAEQHDCLADARDLVASMNRAACFFSKMIEWDARTSCLLGETHGNNDKRLIKKSVISRHGIWSKWRLDSFKKYQLTVRATVSRLQALRAKATRPPSAWHGTCEDRVSRLMAETQAVTHRLTDLRTMWQCMRAEGGQLSDLELAMESARADWKQASKLSASSPDSPSSTLATSSVP